MKIIICHSIDKKRKIKIEAISDWIFKITHEFIENNIETLKEYDILIGNQGIVISFYNQDDLQYPILIAHNSFECIVDDYLSFSWCNPENGLEDYIRVLYQIAEGEERENFKFQYHRENKQFKYVGKFNDKQDDWIK